jgi:hypothetical protein
VTTHLERIIGHDGVVRGSVDGILLSVRTFVDTLGVFLVGGHAREEGNKRRHQFSLFLRFQSGGVERRQLQRYRGDVERRVAYFDWLKLEVVLVKERKGREKRTRLLSLVLGNCVTLTSPLEIARFSNRQL